jgi:hypothetical protein
LAACYSDKLNDGGDGGALAKGKGFGVLSIFDRMDTSLTFDYFTG